MYFFVKLNVNEMELNRNRIKIENRINYPTNNYPTQISSKESNNEKTPL